MEIVAERTTDWQFGRLNLIGRLFFIFVFNLEMLWLSRVLHKKQI